MLKIDWFYVVKFRWENVLVFDWVIICYFVCYKLFRLLLLVVLFFVIDMWIICVVKLLYKYIDNIELIKIKWGFDSDLFVFLKI